MGTSPRRGQSSAEGLRGWLAEVGKQDSCPRGYACLFLEKDRSFPTREGASPTERYRRQRRPREGKATGLRETRKGAVGEVDT